MSRITRDKRKRLHARADECIDKLNTDKNASKPDWSIQGRLNLFIHLQKEIIELHEAIIFKDDSSVEDECKDVVNIALMIFDNLRGNK